MLGHSCRRVAKQKSYRLGSGEDVSEALGLTSTKKSNKLSFAVQSKIASVKSDKPLRSLCRVMEKFSVLEDLAKEMMERFGKWLPC